MNFIERLKSTGPGAMVVAAFIGLGTAITASVAGVRLSCALIWTIAFLVVVTITLQEMNARLGLVSHEGLGEMLRGQFNSPALSGLGIVSVVSAIGVGTAAYETGNVLGGAVGLGGLIGISTNLWGPAMGLVAGVLLWSGKYKLIEKALVGLVSIMAVSFLVDAIPIGPDLGALARGFTSSVPEGSAPLVTDLIGTTVTGYDLFPRAGSVQERWTGSEESNESRADTVLPIILDGFIIILIPVTAVTAFPVGVNIQGVSMMAEQLEPLVGTQAKVFFGTGLFAAGSTGATTASLVDACATVGALDWDADLQSARFHAVWGSILLVGIVLSAVGYSPVQAIVFAQVANGVLPPIVAVFLTYMMNDHGTPGSYASSTLQNVVGGLVTLAAVWFGLRILHTVATDMGVF